MHDFLTVNQHLQPLKARNLANSALRGEYRIRMRDPRSGINAAEMRVAAEWEDFDCVGSEVLGDAEDGGGEAGVENDVVVFADCVEVYEVGDREVESELVAEFGVEEEAVEDVEGGVVGAGVDVRWGWEDVFGGVGALAFAGLSQGLLIAVVGRGLVSCEVGGRVEVLWWGRHKVAVSIAEGRDVGGEAGTGVRWRWFWFEAFRNEFGSTR